MPLGPPEVAETAVAEQQYHVCRHRQFVSMPLGPPEVAETAQQIAGHHLAGISLNALRATRGR